MSDKKYDWLGFIITCKAPSGIIVNLVPSSEYQAAFIATRAEQKFYLGTLNSEAGGDIPYIEYFVGTQATSGIKFLCKQGFSTVEITRQVPVGIIKDPTFEVIVRRSHFVGFKLIL